MSTTLFEKAYSSGIPLPALIDQIRAYAIEKYVDMDILALCRRHGVYIPEKLAAYAHDAAVFELDANPWMHDYSYHLRNRLTGTAHFNEFVNLFPEYKKQAGMKEYLAKEYDLSIMPMNLSRGLEHAVLYFLPLLGYKSKQDPYAIKHTRSVITSRPAGQNKKAFYIATRKHKYATYLFTLTVPWSLDPTKGTFLCPIGCRNCYRGYETRNRQSIVITDTGDDLAASQIKQQTEALVRQWDPSVYDILISGGEPLLFANHIWQESILDVLAECPHIASLRICTGALGLGLFARFDDELLEKLVRFRTSRGVQVGINAHIAHPEQFTPEMVAVSMRLKARTIRIMPQVPLVQGTNFFSEDLQKTILLLRRMARLSAFLLNEPIYKFIVDMQGSVPLLHAIRVYRALFDRHQIDSNIVRPISFELFTTHSVGNLNLSYHTLFAMKLRREGSNAVYEIPHPAGGIVEWVEPLQEGVNDSPALLREALEEPPIEASAMHPTTQPPS